METFSHQKIDPKMRAGAAVKKLMALQASVLEFFGPKPVHPYRELNAKKRTHNEGYIRERCRKFHKSIPEKKKGLQTILFCPCCTNDKPTNFIVNILGLHELPKKTDGDWDDDSIAVPEAHLAFNQEWTSKHGTSEAFVRAFKAHLKEHWTTHHSFGFFINAKMVTWDPPAVQVQDDAVQSANYVR